MANYIDEKFYSLISEFDKLSFYETYTHIVRNFKRIPVVTQISLESYFNRYAFWGNFNMANENFEVFYKKAKVFKENSQDYIWLYENFDLNLLPKCKNEVFVDVGAYIGDTVQDFIQSYGVESYNKIYCYEITKNIFETLQTNLSDYTNIEYRNKAVSNTSGYVNIDENSYSSSANKTVISENGQVEAVKLDDDIDEKITLIKMDIEGGEQDAIRGAIRHITQDLPKMFISVYHNNVDLIEIPKMISNITPDYKFHLRYYGGCVYPTEIVLACLPKQNNN